MPYVVPSLSQAREDVSAELGDMRLVAVSSLRYFIVLLGAVPASCCLAGLADAHPRKMDPSVLTQSWLIIFFALAGISASLRLLTTGSLTVTRKGIMKADNNSSNKSNNMLTHYDTLAAALGESLPTLREALLRALQAVLSFLPECFYFFPSPASGDHDHFADNNIVSSVDPEHDFCAKNASQRDTNSRDCNFQREGGALGIAPSPFEAVGCHPSIPLTYCAVYVLSSLADLRRVSGINYYDNRNNNDDDDKNDKCSYSPHLMPLWALLCDSEPEGGISESDDRSDASSVSARQQARELVSKADALLQQLRSPVQRYLAACFDPNCGFCDDLSGQPGVPGYRGLVPSTDPRTTYSALMLLWLLSRTRTAGHTAVEAPGQCGARAELFDAELQALLGTGYRQALVHIITACYVPHEAAFGCCVHYYAAPGPFPRRAPVLEGHTGLTYCCVVASLLSSAAGHDLVTEAPHILAYLSARQSHFGAEEYKKMNELLGGDASSDTHNKRNSNGNMASGLRSGAGGTQDEEEQDADEGESGHRLPAAVGFAGRPNKDSDTCYSFWNLAAQAVLLNLLKHRQAKGSATARAQDDEEEAVDRFLQQVLGDSHDGDPTRPRRAGPRGAPTSLSADRSVTAFTLMTQNAGALARDPESESDPVHSCLGLAGLCIPTNQDMYINNNNIDVNITSNPLLRAILIDLGILFQ